MATKTPEDAKEAILQYIHERLVKWAEWFMQDSPKGIGFPPYSIEYRLWREGLYIREYQGNKPSPTNDAAEEMEALIKEMSYQNSLFAEVIRVNYLHNGYKEDKAHYLAISPSQFIYQLSGARWWLAGRLTSKTQLRQLVSYFRKIRKA